MKKVFFADALETFYTSLISQKEQQYYLYALRSFREKEHHIKPSSHMQISCIQT